jgi:hypothetical protein
MTLVYLVLLHIIITMYKWRALTVQLVPILKLTAVISDLSTLTLNYFCDPRG